MSPKVSSPWGWLVTLLVQRVRRHGRGGCYGPALATCCPPSPRCIPLIALRLAELPSQFNEGWQSCLCCDGLLCRRCFLNISN